MATKYNLAIIGISHLNKAITSRSVNACQCSLAFVAASRAAYLVAQDPNDKNRLKNNEEFLSDLLKSESKAIQAIKEAASCAGHAWRTIRRAKNELRIVPKLEVVNNFKQNLNSSNLTHV